MCVYISTDVCIEKTCVCVYMYTYIDMNGYRRYIHIYVYTHKMQYYSIIKKNKIMPFEATWMDLEIIVLI